MIAALRGRIDAKTADALLIDVSGVIYRVFTSATTVSDVAEVGSTVEVRTHLFVREDQLTLYGFATDDELHLFETLIGVTGVGPRLACAILSRVRSDRLQDAIARENADFLATVPGVGKKTAARLILELRGKLTPTTSVAISEQGRAEHDEVVEALQALGYSAAEAHEAALSVPPASGLTVEERVFAALRGLSRA